MKKLLTVFSIICLHIPSIGQIEWVGGYGETVGTFMVTSQGHHVLHFIQDYPVLTAIDGQGNEIFQFSVASLDPDAFLLDISDIIELADSSIAFPIIHGSLDGGGTANIGYDVATIDKNWQNLFFCWHGTYISSWNGPKVNRLSDNSLILFSPEIKYTKRWEGEGYDCQAIWEANLDFQVFDLATTSDDHLVWAGNNGLIIMDADGNTDTVYTGLFFEEVQSTSFDGIIGLRQDSLFLLSSGFSLIHSQDFPNDSIIDYSVKYGKIAVLTRNGFVHLFSDSLIFQNSFELTDDSEFQLIDIGPDGLGLAGLETYGSAMPSGGSKTFFTKSYSFDGDNYDMSRDIGIVDVQLGEATHLTDDPWSGYYRIYFNDATVTVENFGDELVNDFFIRSQSHFSGFSQPFKDVSLEANGSLTIVLDDFWIRSPVEPGGMESACLWTSHPDNRLDEDSTNDGYCTDFLVQDEEKSTEIIFHISPNPSQQNSVVYFNLPGGEAASVKMYDNMGRPIYAKELDIHSGTQVLPQTPAGLYFVTLFADDEPVKTARFVRF